MLLVDASDPDRRALHDARADRWLTRGELARDVAALAGKLARPRKSLVLALMSNEVPCVTGYLAALSAGHAVALWAPEPRPEVVDAYRPELVLSAQPVELGPAYSWREISGIHVAEREAARDDFPEIHPDLALLLATSGSTGSPKLVRLSARAVEANARSIAEALAIGPDEVAVTSLPLHYSYGLSVLNSLLISKGSVVVTGEGLLAGTFWDIVRRTGCTTFAGVPYAYQVLERLDLAKLAVPQLTTLTQAGGRLTPEVAQRFHERMRTRGGRFFVMYGQTEATARIAILPSERFPEKVGSAGRAIPGGALAIEDDEVVYRGPNVMMGYSTARADLARGDELGGRLATGDLGRLDDEGFLFLTGRARRIAKLTGFRVNLDDVEALAAPRAPAAAVARDERLVVFAVGLDAAAADELRRALAAALKVNATLVEVRGIDALPLTPSGKVDYRALEAAA